MENRKKYFKITEEELQDIEERSHEDESTKNDDNISKEMIDIFIDPPNNTDKIATFDKNTVIGTKQDILFSTEDIYILYIYNKIKENKDPLRVYLAGSAGVGKSFVIS